MIETETSANDLLVFDIGCVIGSHTGLEHLLDLCTLEKEISAGK